MEIAGGRPMSAWGPDELDRIGRATELQIASRRSDGSLRPFVTIWTVRTGDDVYVRSAHGYENPWFQRALRPWLAASAPAASSATSASSSRGPRLPTR